MNDSREIAMRALVMKYLADVTAGGIKQHRDSLSEVLENGDRINVPAPDGSRFGIGHVLRTRPKGTATVTDRAAFTTWMAAAYPGRVHTVLTLPDRNREEAIQVLHGTAPHLLHEEMVVEPWAESEVVKLTCEARQPCGPGRELDVPGVTYEPPGSGVVRVELTDDAPAIIQELWRAGRVDLVSGEVRALSGGAV